MRANPRSIRVAKQIAGSARTIVIVPLQRESPRDINSKKGRSRMCLILRRPRMNQTQVIAELVLELGRLKNRSRDDGMIARAREESGFIGENRNYSPGSP